MKCLHIMDKCNHFDPATATQCTQTYASGVRYKGALKHLQTCIKMLSGTQRDCKPISLSTKLNSVLNFIICSISIIKPLEHLGVGLYSPYVQWYFQFVFYFYFVIVILIRFRIYRLLIWLVKHIFLVSLN